MADSIIVCPKCKAIIPLTSAIEGPIAERLKEQFEAANRAKEVALQEREKMLAAARGELDKAKERQEQEVAQRLAAERMKLAAEEKKKAEAQLAVDMGDLRNQLMEQAKKLAAAQTAELELRKKGRELEEKKQAFELEMARKLDQERELIKAATQKAADEGHRLKEAEREQIITAMRRQIDELKQKAEQGSQQIQGEVLELELEQILRATFPHDQIVAVAKGVHGGDVMQRVMTPTMQYCGTILWESKRTKTWSDGWIDKLKGDQRAAKADLAVIVSMAMPRDVTHMKNVDGVWVTSRECMMALVGALRSGLVRVGEAKVAEEGKHEKMEVLYRYFSGHEFKQRVEAIVDTFTMLREDLEKEKRAMMSIWAKREKQLDRVMASTTGMHGDLSGIIGGAMPVIEAMELPTLAGAGEE